MPTQPSRAEQLLGDLAPKTVQLTDDVLFGDVWKREGNGLTRDELVEALTHVAFYAGRPSGTGALVRLKGIVENEKA